MNDFKKNGGFGGGRPSFGGGRDNNRGGFAPRRDFGSGDRGGFGGRPVELHQAVCADCGKSCEVPFKPNGRKPVYCKDCFARSEGTAESGSRPSRDNSFVPKPFFKAPSPAGDKRIDDLKIQLDSVNYKLEKLIKMLEGSKTDAPKIVTTNNEVKAVKVEKTPAKKTASKKEINYF